MPERLQKQFVACRNPKLAGLVQKSIEAKRSLSVNVITFLYLRPVFLMVLDY